MEPILEQAVDKILRELKLAPFICDAEQEMLQQTLAAIDPHETGRGHTLARILHVPKEPTEFKKLHDSLLLYRKITNADQGQKHRHLLNAVLTMYHAELFIKQGDTLKSFFNAEQYREYAGISLYQGMAAAFRLKDECEDTAMQKLLAAKQAAYGMRLLRIGSADGQKPRLDHVLLTARAFKEASRIYGNPLRFPNNHGMLKRAVSYYQQAAERDGAIEDGKPVEVFSGMLLEAGKACSLLGRLTNDAKLSAQGQEYVQIAQQRREHYRAGLTSRCETRFAPQSLPQRSSRLYSKDK